MIIFEAISILNKKIALIDTQLFHILLHHDELSDQIGRMKETLINPDFVLYDKKENNFQYYRYYRYTSN